MPVSVSDCYHDSLGVSLAEERLRKFGQEGGYLTRQSDVKPGFFILSVIEKGKIVHQVAPNNNGKFFEQTYDEAAIVLEELIQSKVECEHPVPPSEGAAVSPVEKKSSQCKACSFTNEDSTKVRNHQQAHYVKKCPNCQKFLSGVNFRFNTATLSYDYLLLSLIRNRWPTIDCVSTVPRHKIPYCDKQRINIQNKSKQ